MTRGFLYVKEADEVVAKMKDEAEKAYNSLLAKDPKANSFHVCNYVKRVLDGVSHRSLARSPLVVPWIMNV
ncbi:hypothetical protein COT83_04780 [Candidatus Peregrinibacteria bacterium CG10_big_fil_rev_8_21_14_0_10_44_7]|nr:MAG: hypothetical protein COT83_04780 [Candidatus Peregrinibacteria bacterium CG10_big_fil_rev_8_21_14_0_10_44_7]